MTIRRAVVAMLGLVLGLVAPLTAKYGRVDIEDVPVERLIRNLEAAAAKTPTDPAAWRTLTRAHALAYAQKSATLPALRGSSAALWFGYEPAHVPFPLTPAADDAVAMRPTFDLVLHRREPRR